MANPFQERAAEYLRDAEAFLTMVTPEPLVTFLEEPAKEGCLYDRLAMIIGTPGSGKTTLARLFEFTTLRTLLRSQHLDDCPPGGHPYILWGDPGRTPDTGGRSTTA